MRSSFETSQLCLSGAFCSSCRALETGKRQRRTLARSYRLPPGAPDFPCPHGRPWSDDEEPHRDDRCSNEIERRVVCGVCPNYIAREERQTCRLFRGADCSYDRAMITGGPWPDECPQLVKEGVAAHG